MNRVAADYLGNGRLANDCMRGIEIVTGFSPNEISSMRISHRAQKPFLNSIQALEREDNPSRMKLEGPSDNYRSVGESRGSGSRPEGI